MNIGFHKVMECNMEFFGYTWDNFFHVISDKEGILVVYRGSLDYEGAPLMKEILFVDYGKKLSDIYNSDCLQSFKMEQQGRGDAFFTPIHPQATVMESLSKKHWLRSWNHVSIVNL